MSRIVKTEVELAKREIANGGRWCEVTMKKNGDVVRIVRIGHGPMELPQWDDHMIFINGEQMFGYEFSNLGQVAAWICERY